MLPFVPIATLTAIISPGLTQPGGAWDLSLLNGRLSAGAVTVVIAAATRNVLLTIACGFAVLWLAS
jgi:branched-subunit amino acid transport protein